MASAGAIHAQVVELHAAVRGVQALLDRAVAEQVEHQLGEDLVHVLQVEVDASAVTSTARARWCAKRSHSSARSRAPEAGCAIISRQRDLEDGARLILTMSFSVYSRPGIANQWQPE